jgi:hypothetical protein
MDQSSLERKARQVQAAIDAQKAMADYIAEGKATTARTAKLREARLARDAAVALQVTIPSAKIAATLAPRKKTAKPRKRQLTPPVPTKQN